MSESSLKNGERATPKKLACQLSVRDHTAEGSGGVPRLPQIWSIFLPVRKHLTDKTAFGPAAIEAMSKAFEEACIALQVYAGDEKGREIIATRIVDGPHQSSDSDRRSTVCDPGREQSWQQLCHDRHD
jgi:hypothetical protein